MDRYEKDGETIKALECDTCGKQIKPGAEEGHEWVQHVLHSFRGPTHRWYYCPTCKWDAEKRIAGKR